MVVCGKFPYEGAPRGGGVIHRKVVSLHFEDLLKNGNHKSYDERLVVCQAFKRRV